MELRSMTMNVFGGEGAEVKVVAFFPGATIYDFEAIAHCFNNLSLNDTLEVDTAKAEVEPTQAQQPPEPEAEPEAEPQIDAIPDTELLTAVSKVAERIGADKAKDIVKAFSIGRGRPTVKNIPAGERVAFMNELKAAMAEEMQPAAEPASDPEPQQAPASPSPRRRRG